ncbi:MAG: cysteine--tRNA ligase [Thermodesulfobacteriota bacterium]
MTIRIYNSLTRKKEIFVPVHPGKVGMYVCGPTVYDSCHIGHARSVVVFDVIARYFRSQGYEVTYIRNFTDVDDKIIQRAAQLGVSTTEVAEKYIAEFHEDMDSLYVERPTHEPRATDHIEDIVRIISELVRKELAYVIDGDVFFRVTAFDQYGKLSGRRLEDMEAGARIDVDSRKQNPFDFALWKSAKPGEPAWQSPWGSGRPGWHIECSAMSKHFLGDTFDIHGGGKDLIFPHHENEIAQSEAAHGKGFAKFWIHNGFVNINHEKMSKSLGNFKVIREVLKTVHPEAVRLFLLSHHYRNPIDFSDKTMMEISSGLDKLYTTLERLDQHPAEWPATMEPLENTTWLKFQEAMNDDFNTAKGIGILFEAVQQVKRLLDGKNEADPVATASRLASFCSDMRKIGGILGIFSESPGVYFQKRAALAARGTDVDANRVEDLIKAREAARKARDWATADRIRAELTAMDVVLEDRPEGTIWRVEKS